MDTSPHMLAAFRERADGLGARAPRDRGAVAGRRTEAPASHDVVVVHHVVFNVPDLVPFLQALDADAARRVVLELPPHHPLSWMNFLWEQFHDLARPSGPTAGDVVEILSELGYRRPARGVLDPSRPVRGWRRRRRDARGARRPGHAAPVPAAERAPEVAAALDDVDPGYHRDVVTISWTPGSAPRSDTHR